MKSCKILGFVLIYFVLIGINHPAPAETNKTLCIQNGMLIDGTGSVPIDDAIVLIANGRIIEIGPKSKIEIPSNSKIFDARGATILPGFINAHVHKAYNSGLLQVWAQAGVTTVRDLAAYPPYSSYEKRDQLNKDIKNARLVATSPQMTGGFIPRGYTMSIEIDSVEGARKEALRVLGEGADQLKIMLESNWGNRVMSDEAAGAIVKIAHQYGKKVSVHISLSRDIGTAIEIGVDDLAHMALDRVSDELLKKIVDAGIYWTPTIEVWKGLASRGRVSDTYVLNNLGRFADFGGKVALGTDYGGAPFFFEFGMPMKEINWMNEAGMSPMEIIIAATKNAAEVCGLGNELGTLEQGKIADIFLIDGNPIHNLDRLNKVKVVIKEGKIIRNDFLLNL